MDWVNILKHYRESDGVDNNELLDEAIDTCENYFETMDENTLMHHSRPLVISYLALNKVKAEQYKLEAYEKLKEDVKKNLDYINELPLGHSKHENESDLLKGLLILMDDNEFDAEHAED